MWLRDGTSCAYTCSSTPGASMRSIHCAVAVLAVLSTTACSEVADAPGDDAVVLALRYQQELFLDDDLARTYDDLLERGRTVDARLALVHARPNVFPDRVLVQTDVAAVEASWASGALATGIESLDALLESIELSSINTLQNEAGSYLHFERAVRPQTLAASIRAYPGFRAFVELNYGDGVDITIEELADAHVLTFRLGWGDCLSGCIFAHLWRVRVAVDSVSLLDESGDELPPDIDRAAADQDRRSR
jgi:hypothetical protein